MKHLERIRNQPEHIRQLWAGLCTLVIGAFVVGAWFQSFQATGYALLNPDQVKTAGSPLFAGDNQSLFASMGQTLKEGAAAIGQVWASFSGKQGPIQIQGNGLPQTSVVPVYTLPISGNK